MDAMPIAGHKNSSIWSREWLRSIQSREWLRTLNSRPVQLRRTTPTASPTAVGCATTPGRAPTRATAAPDLYDVGRRLRDDIGRQRCRVRRSHRRRPNADRPNHCKCGQLHPAPPSKTYRRLAQSPACAARKIRVVTASLLSRHPVRVSQRQRASQSFSGSAISLQRKASSVHPQAIRMNLCGARAITRKQPCRSRRAR